MKKLICFITIIFSLIFVSSCGIFNSTPSRSSINLEYVGTYEMVNISGTLTYKGYTIKLDKSLYKYFRVTLSEDGTALVESGQANTTTVYSASGTWSDNGNIINIISYVNGEAIVEQMTWDNGKITYITRQTISGIICNIKVVLKKET